jgi:hypothetical protein
MTKAVPFRIRCKLCNTVAESWHSIHAAHVPEGRTIGMASCECGKVQSDSMGVGPKVGRILTDEPDESWELVTD